MLGVASVPLALEGEDDRRPFIRLAVTHEPIVVRGLCKAGSRKQGEARTWRSDKLYLSTEIMNGFRNRSDGCEAVSG